MNRKYYKSVLLGVCVAILPFLECGCYSPPKSQFIRDEVVANEPLWVVRDAVFMAMAEKNILIKTKEDYSNATFTGNLLVDVEQYADCGKYYGRKVSGFADMNFEILAHRLSNNSTGIQITSTVSMQASDLFMSKGKSMDCVSNGRMERELLDAVLKHVR